MTKINKRSGGNPASNVRQVVNSVLAQRAEEKYCNSTLSVALVPITGTVTAVTQDIIQGDNVNERSGNAIYMQKLDLRFTAFTSGIVSSVLRFIVVMDKLNTGTLPTVTNILEAARSTSPPSINPYVNKRFVFLYDELIPIVCKSTTSVGLITRRVQKTIAKKISYFGPANVAASNGTNSIFTLMITDTGLSSGPNVAYDVGLHYTDI